MGSSIVGTQIGNFQILEKLGEGGMGVVYKGVDLNLDRPVAIKVLNTELTGNPELEQRFRAEARAQGNLNHTNLATLYSLHIENGRPWMIMEFIEGETFEQMIQRRGPIPAQEAIPLFKQALLGIGYAHRMGIVHRDIKPSNLMLNKQGMVKVMDFGIAKVLGGRGMTRTGTQMGTAYYMSPEQVLNRGVDIRSDIYSLGVTLYEMLCANVPFSGDSDYQIMTDHVNTPPPLPTRFYPYIPKGVENAVLKAIAKDQGQRFQTVEEFGVALEQPDAIAYAAPMAAAAAVQPSPASAVQPAAAPVAPASTPSRGRDLKVIGAAVGVLLLLVAGYAALKPKPKPSNSGLGPNVANNTVNPFPSSGGELKILKDGTVPQGVPGQAGQAPQSKPQSGATAGVENAKATQAPPVMLIPAGTQVTIRMIGSVDSSRDRPGQRFEASIESPVVVNSRTIIPRGANARVALVAVNQAGHIEGRSDVQLELVGVSVHGRNYPVRSNLFERQGSSRGKRSALVIGGAAAAGAAIGGIFGRKKGAAVGAAAGAGGGTATQMMTKGEAVVIPSETVIGFVLRTPVMTSP